MDSRTKQRGIRCVGLHRGASKEAEAIAKELAEWTGAKAVFEIRGKHGAIRLERPDGTHAFQLVALSSSDWRAQANAVCRIRRILRALGCTKLTTEVEDTHASTEAREFVPTIIKPPSVAGEAGSVGKTAKRFMRAIMLDRSKPYWRIMIDGQEAAAYATFDECTDKKWPPNATFEFENAVPPTPHRTICSACGGVVRTDALDCVGYEEDFFGTRTL